MVYRGIGKSARRARSSSGSGSSFGRRHTPSRSIPDPGQESSGRPPYSYHAPYKYHPYPLESECGRYYQPPGITYYFNTKEERDTFEREHEAKIKAVWEIEEAEYDAWWEIEKQRRKAERERQEAEWREAQHRLYEQQLAYDAETARMGCFWRKLRNISDWCAGTHSWRGVRF